MNVRCCRIAGFASALILAWTLLGPGVTRAQEATPVITTPTPVPSPTPTEMPLRQRMLLTPEGQRLDQLAFLPLILRDAGERALEANPDGFSYVVRPGDTLWSLALDFGRDLDTMSCATTPTGADAEGLIPGESITVPALKDLCYTVTPFDTLAGIAAQHGLSVDAIAAVPWNGFTSRPYTVRARQRVLLPGARPLVRARPDRRAVSYANDPWARSAYPNWPYGDGKFAWPVAGPISQYAHDGHWAIDIATPLDTPVKAADRGTVTSAGWSPIGYGFRVVIDHGNDYVTLYAHLRDIYVEQGQIVGKGQVIGNSGANGNITGPHLHFEIRDFGSLTNPLTLLPK